MAEKSSESKENKSNTTIYCVDDRYRVEGGIRFPGGGFGLLLLCTRIFDIQSSETLKEIFNYLSERNIGFEIHGDHGHDGNGRRRDTFDGGCGFAAAAKGEEGKANHFGVTAEQFNIVKDFVEGKVKENKILTVYLEGKHEATEMFVYDEVNPLKYIINRLVNSVKNTFSPHSKDNVKGNDKYYICTRSEVIELVKMVRNHFNQYKEISDEEIISAIDTFINGTCNALGATRRRVAYTEIFGRVLR